MLQFYKMNFEAAQSRIGLLERQLKKAKREAQHQQAQVHQLTQVNRALQFDFDTQQIQLGGEMLHSQTLLNQRDVFESRLHSEEEAHTGTMTILGDVLRDHPELASDYEERIRDHFINNVYLRSELMQQHIGQIEEELGSDSDTDSQATEPEEF